MECSHLLHVVLMGVLLVSGRGLCLKCLILNNAVDCKNQNLQTIPRIMNQIAETMDFSENSLTSLYNQSFSFRYEPVTRLLLTHNKMVNVETGSFVPLRNIQYLDLSYNNISFLNPETFASNEMLNSLSISHNPLVTLPIIKSGTIETLLAEFCDVTMLAKETFLYLDKLRTLSLAGNSIHYVGVEAMKPLKYLHQLRIEEEFQNNCYDLDFHPGLQFLVNESPVRVIAEICDIEMYKDHEMFYAHNFDDTQYSTKISRCSLITVLSLGTIYFYIGLRLLLV